MIEQTSTQRLHSTASFEDECKTPPHDHKPPAKFKLTKKFQLIFALFLLTVSSGSLVGQESDPFGPLADWEKKALINHPDVRLVQDEVGVSAAKKHEAARAAWPTLNLKAERTEGESVEDLGTPNFTEKSYGIEMSQTVVQGGKLLRTYQQAKANWESLKAKADKVNQDVLFNVRESYWGLAKSQRTLDIHERALNDLENEIISADSLLGKGAITKETHLIIAGQTHQTRLTIESAKADVEAQLWKWTAALGLTSPPGETPESDIPDAVPFQLTIDDCLRTARLNNPEFLIQQKTTRAALYGYKAGRSSYWPRIGLTGFYGRSGAAFEGETLELSEDYQVGVQLSQYFALNTLNTSGFKQRTSPKIGQTTRTEAETVTGSLGILDGFKQNTEIKESALTYHQAEVHLQKMEMDISNRVREAYAGWKKAQAQLAIATNDLPLAQTEFAIAKIKTAHREFPLSEKAVKRNRLAQAEAALIEAKVNYQISLAVLSRAVGVPYLISSIKR